MTVINCCLTGNESIIGLDSIDVCKFWSWAYSDILSNRNRAVFGEFLVAVALGVTDIPRIEWDSVDINYRNTGIEVKTAAYIQNWHQKSHSIIRFDISKKKSWIAETNTLIDIPERTSSLFVFCLYTEKSKDKANILDINKWEFYILSTSIINEIFGIQKSVGLSKIQNLCEPVSFIDLKAKIDKVILSN